MVIDEIDGVDIEQPGVEGEIAHLKNYQNFTFRVCP